jgi:menaquinone-specific isochorismate synthase
VGGVPGETALSVIRECEAFERGWYAAPVGWVDADGNGDFVVAIRSGLFQGNTATLFGGAGIVADSDPQKEWDETGLKARFLLDAMQGEMA